MNQTNNGTSVNYNLKAITGCVWVVRLRGLSLSETDSTPAQVSMET